MGRANAAYYAGHDPFRDFTTAPEISQVFGELLGAWASVVWDAMGRPDPVLFVECGPGRGTLMADACRGIECVSPAFARAQHLHLIETSPLLRGKQANVLPRATWHDSVLTVPPGPMILIANEFLDALPIRQFVRRAAGWMERQVADGQFVERSGDPPAALLARYSLDSLEPGTVIESGAPAAALVGQVAARIAECGGAAIFLDYGYATALAGDSLQAIRDGRPADPLQAAGEADLTAHVDFGAIADAARQAGARVHGPVAQGAFLIRLGLFARSQQLARGKPPDVAVDIMDNALRLSQPERMGRLFKVLAITHPTLPMLPGFETEQTP